MPTPSLPTHSRSHRVRRLGAAVVCTALAAGATQGLATTDARAATDLVPFVCYEKILQTMYLDTPTLAPSVAAAELAKLRNAVNAHSASLVSGHGGQQQPGLLGVISSIIGNIKFRPQLVEAVQAVLQVLSPTTSTAGSATVFGTATASPTATAAQLVAANPALRRAAARREPDR
jgi:hypothetical protein